MRIYRHIRTSAQLAVRDRSTMPLLTAATIILDIADITGRLLRLLWFKWRNRPFQSNTRSGN